MNKLTYIIITALLLLLPWFFNEQISNQVDTDKNIIIGITTSITLILWAIFLFKQKSVAWFTSPIDKAIILIICSALISTLFSIQRDTSIWGYNLRQTGGLVSLINIIFLFLIIFQNLRDKNLLIRVLKIIPISLALYAFFIFLKNTNILGSLSQDLKLEILQVNPLLNPLISPAGDIKAITTLFVISLPIALFIVIDKKTTSTFERIFSFIISGFLILGIFSNIYNIGDIFFKTIISTLVITTTTFVLIFGFRLTNRISFSIIMCLILMGVAIIGSFIALNSTIPSAPTIPIGTTTSILSRIVNDDPLRALFGTGLDTYKYTFSKYRPETQNLSSDWYINHIEGNTQIEGLIINSGLFGIFGFVVLIYLILKFIAVKVLKPRLHSQDTLILALCTSTILFLLSFFFTTHSIVLITFGWLILAILFSYYTALNQNLETRYVIELKFISKLRQNINIAPITFSFLMAIIGSILLFCSVKNLLSEIYFQQTLIEVSNGQYEDANSTILKAIKYNDGKDYYYTELASIIMVRLNFYIDSTQSTINQIEDPIIPTLVLKLEDAFNKAIQLNSAEYYNWQAAAIFNKNLYKLLKEPRYEEAALYSLEEALKRYPTGPDINLLLADQYDNSADPQKLELTEAAFTKAYSLQPSYIVSIIKLGKFLERENKDELALALYSTSRQEFFSTDSDFNTYLTERIAILKKKLED